MKLRVDIVSTKKDWNKVLEILGEHDFPQTFDFHRISMSYGEGEPLAFVARDEADLALAMWPVLKRGIDGTDLFDFTSVYGYAGPILAAGIACRPVIEAIFDAMRRYGAVSLFSRMHPLFADRLDEDMRGNRLGDVVVVDVGAGEDVLGGYRGSHRREIIKARAQGVIVTTECGASAVSDFLDIYHQAMTDLGAKRYYFFDNAYLSALEEATDFRTLIFFASLEGKKIAASMFVVTGSLMQYYLSGTLAEFRRLALSKAIIAEAHGVAAKMGLSRLVLGGGVGSSRDALLAFKQGFSPLSFPFHVTRRVLNDESYSALCTARGIDRESVQFFPAYRAEPAKVD